jgi:soluble lytic murein transglycosylase
MKSYSIFITILTSLSLAIAPMTTNANTDKPKIKKVKSTLTKKKHAHATPLKKQKETLVPMAAFFTSSGLVKNQLEQLQLLSVNNPNAAQTLLNSFLDKPLEGYARFLWLRPHVEDKSFNSLINQYLTQFSDTGWAETLRQEWSESLAKQQDWSTLLENQQQLNKDNARCWVLEAMQQQNQVPESWVTEVSQRWLIDNNPSNGCKSIYNRIETMNELTTEQWQTKLSYLYSKQKQSVIATKIAYLPALLQTETQQTLSLMETPSLSATYALLHETINTNEQKESYSRIVMHVLQSKIKTDAQAVFPIWKEAKTVFQWDSNSVENFEKELYRQLAKNEPEQQKEWIGKIAPALRDEATVLPLIQQAWRESNWTDLLSYLNWLPVQEQQADIWQYWRARSLDALGQTEEAKTKYRQLATHRSFYGFMAADKVNLNYQFNAQQVTELELEHARQSVLGQRLQALYEAGLKDVAWKEWHFARNNNKISLSEIPGFSQAALSWGWNTFSALSLNHPTHWNYVDLRFSMPYHTLLQDNTQQYDIPLSWAYGIMRRESVYAIDAKSKSGAMGLMQLMPKTAKSLEKIKNINDVYLPELNIKLGTKLLGQLKHDFGDNLVLASAAYNAGGFRVRQWLKQTPVLSTDQWIELIPFKETRDYVKSVMEYMLVFERLSGNLTQTKLDSYLMTEPTKILITENKCNPDFEWCL